MIGYKSDKGTNGIYYNEYTGEIGLLKDIGFFKRLLFRYKPKFFEDARTQIIIDEMMSVIFKIKYLKVLRNNLLDNIKGKSKELPIYNECKNLIVLRKSILSNKNKCGEELSNSLINLIDKLIKVDNEIFSLPLKIRKMKNNIEINIAIYNRAIYLDKDKGE